MAMYLQKAEQLSNSLGSPEELSWDNKGSGVQILLAAVTGKQVYKDRADQFCTRVLTQKQKTQDGLVFIQQWGSLRHASNVAFACLFANQKGLLANDVSAQAKKQIDYILGDNSKKFSFIIGYGDKFPVNPHHRSSSCPETGTCTGTITIAKDQTHRY